MAQSAGLHEPEDRLSTDTIDRHRALTSIQEELEAVDWYAQRVDATDRRRSGRGPRAQPRRGEGTRGHDASNGCGGTIPCSIGTCAPTSSPPDRSSNIETRGRGGRRVDAAATGSGSLGIGSLKRNAR